MNSQTDYAGNPVNVGDDIAAIDPGYLSLTKMRVLKLTPKGVTAQPITSNGELNDGFKPVFRQRCQYVKIS